MQKSISLLITSLFAILLVSGCASSQEKDIDTNKAHMEKTAQLHKKAQELKKQRAILKAKIKEFEKEKEMIEAEKEAIQEKKKELRHSFYTHD